MELPSFDVSLGPGLIAALEEIYQTSPCPVKALVLSNPHNPLGRCYSRDGLEQCLKFCQQRNIQFVSDEVFALSVFSCPDITDPSPFVSVLSLHPISLSCDPERVHVVWSMSKDLAASGARLVCPFLAWISALLTLAQGLHSNTEQEPAKRCRSGRISK